MVFTLNFNLFSITIQAQRCTGLQLFIYEENRHFRQNLEIAADSSMRRAARCSWTILYLQLTLLIQITEIV